MLALGLSLVLQVAGAPSAVDLAARMHLGQVEAPPPPGSALPLYADQRSLFELTREYEQLQNDRPGLGFPIAFMAIGTAVLAIDALLLIYAAVGLSSWFFPYVYIVIGVIAAGFLVPGIIMLPVRLRKRSETDAKLNDLAALIRLREAQSPVAPRYDDVPPPPPPPPPPPAPTGAWPVPETGLAIAAW